ncbi:molybdenum cofactor biosynthesis protein MoaE [Marinoscillum furvescens]|uniref:Molybdopterin synthase catalytic subunit n=1 Tax=Marinoscillum furvescens DSM 4134 TaxID=1122208 RepID=A0A3D9LGM6_MARFU|nr:molybdenum cofactor biosynthesis protein MoaE [Marinoscillum furvescens]REE05614.1 molybdopterin synthase catalytic subunit [Marinoscillum furvescens DSM 4134]
MKKKPKNIFVEGAIPPEKLATSVANHQDRTNIGAHSIFLGQVRADEIDGKVVEAIEFSAYEEMANETYAAIREEVFEKFDLTCAHVYHSLGTIPVGQLCFYVFTSSQRRKQAMAATEYFVEEIKKRVPIFGKELFEGEGHQWKVNS